VNDHSGQPVEPAWARDWLANVWPRTLPSDSDLQRRNKFAVCAGHLAMVAMIGVAAAASVAAGFRQFSGAQLAGLGAAALAHIAWSLYGTSGAVRMLLWDRGTPPPHSSRLPRCGAPAYFSIHIVLAGLVYHLGDRGNVPTLIWLVLLPPVANSVFLLERTGSVLVSAATTLVFAGNVAYWHGWGAVPYALLAFLFAVLFTLVFTSLAVTSEKAREDVQRLASELGEANRRLRELAAQAEELAATRERNRLAREIHDSLGHYLTVVNVQLEAARALQTRDPLRAAAALDKAQSLTHEGLQEIRRSVATLRASPLDNRPLAEALSALLEECRSAGLAAEMQVLGEARGLSPQAALTLYRAGQEGLTNARKHARAKSARLALDFLDATKVRLRVSDDGVGMAESPGATGGFGLLGLRERAQLLGGVVRWQAVPNAGFTLEVEVPG
jgi:signal transduction histidine kinase